MPRIFKGSESKLRLLISKSCDYSSLTDIKIILYTTDVQDAIEIVDDITVEGNVAILSLGGRAFLHMEDGLINYIIEGMVDGDVFHTERQSDYMLKTIANFEGGLTPQVLSIRKNGLYQITPEDEAYVDIYTEVPTPKIQETGFIKLRAGESGVLKPEKGFDGIAEVEYVAVPNEDLNAYIDKNGVHEFDAHTDNSGFGHVKIEVEVPTPKILPNAQVELKAGDNGTYYPVGYDGVASIDYNVLPNYDIEFDFNDNGTYEFDPPAGFSGFGHARLNVDVPMPKIQEPIDIELSAGDKGSIFPDPGYAGIAQVNFTVLENAGPIKLPSGIKFEFSTYTGAFDMSPYDWELVSEWYRMFYECTGITEFINFPTDAPAKNKCFSEVFYNCKSLTKAPELNYSGVISLYNLFYGCKELTSIPWMDTSSVIDFRGLYTLCRNLISVPELDTSNAINLSQMYYGCMKLTAIPWMDTSKCIDMFGMFYTCQEITTIPEIDTSNVTNMKEMFYTCSNLASIPKMNTSKCTNMSYMFNNCQNLKSVTGFDITNVTDFSRMFYRCSKLEEVQFTGELQSTATVTNMFQNVTSQGTFYYPANYADSYQKIINILPATWVAIGE